MKLYPLALTLVPYFPVGLSYNSYLARATIFPLPGNVARCVLRRLLNRRFSHTVCVQAIAIGEFDANFGKITKGSVPLPGGDLPFNFVIHANFHTYAHIVYISAKYTISLSLRIFINRMAARTTRCMHHCVDCDKK